VTDAKKYVLKKQPVDIVPTESPRQFRINYRNELNPAQYAAVTSANGPHLIIAGAGTGKTRTITFRVAYLVELGVTPNRVSCSRVPGGPHRKCSGVPQCSWTPGARKSPAGHSIRLRISSCDNTPR